MWYLDCYHYGALLGQKFPVNSYGPANIEEICLLCIRISHNFHRIEIVKESKGQNVLPKNKWPD